MRKWKRLARVAALTQRLAEYLVLVRWPRLSEQIFRLDKWSPCQG
jgi:hypothetical protein